MEFEGTFLPVLLLVSRFYVSLSLSSPPPPIIGSLTLVPFLCVPFSNSLFPFSFVLLLLPLISVDWPPIAHSALRFSGELSGRRVFLWTSENDSVENAFSKDLFRWVIMLLKPYCLYRKANALLLDVYWRWWMGGVGGGGGARFIDWLNDDLLILLKLSTRFFSRRANSPPTLTILETECW